MRIAFTTLGCKINQYETDLLRQYLVSRGNTIVPFDEQADVYIINTCSVTAKSDTQCRQIIRSVVRRAQGAKVVVTGCYAETRPQEIKSIPGVDLVFGNADKSAIPHYLMPSEADHETNANVPLKAVRVRTRGFLKIQDGCNNRCSYCIVPFARGRSRSVAPTTVMAEFRRLIREGCPEVVITGIHIGTYGIDLAEQVSLTGIISFLISERGNARIRLSSIEPKEITDEMVRFLGRGLCRHLHIPLQSGDDTILMSMKRNYTSGFYRELLGRISQEVPGVALGADVMVGYPGEGEEEFQNTQRLVEAAPLTHLHVFSYSPRPGTAAAAMQKQVPETIKRKRSEALRSLGNEKNLEFRKKHYGTEVHVVVEDKKDEKTGTLSGLTDNYLRVQIIGARKKHIGKEMLVKIIDIKNDKNFATII